MPAFTASALETKTIKLGWNANPERNITSYELRYGTASGNHTKRILTTETSVKVPNLEAGTTYYFVVLARNKAGLVSPKSAEITYRFDERAARPPKGEIATPASSLTINAGDKVEFRGDASDPNGNKPLSYYWDFGTDSGIPPADTRNPGFRQFDRPGVYTVSFTVTNSLGRPDPTPSTRIIVVNERPTYVVPRTKWKMKYVSSQEKTDAKGLYAFDGNPATFWHSKWRGKKPKGPHEIQIDLGVSGNISGFRYLPRQDGITVGNIGKYEFYVSKNGKDWGKPVAKGTFDGSSAEKQVTFATRTARYVKLRALRAAGGETDCNVAELQILKIPKATAITATSTLAGGRSTTAGDAPSAAPAQGGSDGNGPALQATGAPVVITTEVVGGKKYRALSIRKSSLPVGTRLVVQVSPDLLEWFSGKNHTTVLLDNAEVLKVRDNTPVSAGKKRHIRLKP